jgi:Flp pilus assembly protein TadG
VSRGRHTGAAPRLSSAARAQIFQPEPALAAPAYDLLKGADSMVASSKTGRIRPHRRRSRGQSFIEFAVVMPIFLVMLGTVMDFGLVFLQVHVVQNAVREGARLASTLPNLLQNDARVVNAVKAKIPNVNLFSDFLDNGISSTAPTGNVAACDLVVTVSGTGRYNFLMLRLVGMNNVNITRSVSSRYELCS